MEPHASSSPPLETDLYCMRCGYNLRGLSGDPIRCPECGKANEIETVIETAPLVTAHIERIESALNMMTLMSMLSPPVAVLLVRPSPIAGKYRVLIACAVFLLLCWALICRRYEYLTRGVARRAAAAVYYQLGVLVLCSFAAGGLLWPLFVFSGPRRGAFMLPLILASAAIFGVATLCAAVYYTRWMRQRLEPLKREVAMRVVSEFLRSRDRAKYLTQTQKFQRATADDPAQT